MCFVEMIPRIFTVYVTLLCTIFRAEIVTSQVTTLYPPQGEANEKSSDEERRNFEFSLRTPPLACCFEVE